MVKRQRLINGMLILTFANIISKVLGFLKNILFSYYYGASVMTDAFILAEAVPLALLGIFTSAADSAVIPQYNRILQSRSRKDADENFSNILNIILSGAIFISFLILGFPYIFIGIFAPGFAGDTKAYAEQFLRYFAFIGVFHIVYCFTCAYSAAYNKITVRVILSLMPNIIILGALFLYHDENMLGITAAYLGTHFLSAIIPYYHISKTGYQHKIILNFQSAEFKRFIENFLPIVGVALLTETQLFIDKFLASGIQGGISYLNYASRLTGIFDAVLVSGIGLIILPVLSRYNNNQNIERMTEFSCKILKYLFISLSVISCLFIVCSTEITEIIYGRGQFEQEAVMRVGQILSVYGIDIVLIPLQTIMIKVFHSMEDTKLPFKINCITVVLNIIFSMILFQLMGLNGIAAGTAISFSVSCLLLIMNLKTRIGWNKEELGLKHVGVVFCALILVIAVAYLLKQSIENIIYRIMMTGIISFTGYFFIIGLFLKREREEMLSYIQEIIRK